MDGDPAYLVKDVLCFYTVRGGKLLWADLEEMHPSAAEIPLFLLHCSCRLLSKLSQNEQKGEIFDVKLEDRMKTRHTGSCAAVVRTVVISGAAGSPSISFLVCVPLGCILLCLAVVSHCSTFF